MKQFVIRGNSTKGYSLPYLLQYFKEFYENFRIYVHFDQFDFESNTFYHYNKRKIQLHNTVTLCIWKTIVVSYEKTSLKSRTFSFNKWSLSIRNFIKATLPSFLIQYLSSGFLLFLFQVREICFPVKISFAPVAMSMSDRRKQERQVNFLTG